MKPDSAKRLTLVATRLVMGWMFLWAFLDKTFGLGFATESEAAWLEGGSPTEGFLSYATRGPLAEIFQSMAGNPVVDWLFMLGLLGVGFSMMTGIGMRIGGWSGALMTFLMWLSVLPPEHNPIIDEHIVYVVVFMGLVFSDAGDHFGLGKWWKKCRLVKKFSCLI